MKKLKENFLVWLFFVLVPVIAVAGGLWLTNVDRGKEIPNEYEEGYEDGYDAAREKYAVDDRYDEGYADAERDHIDDYQNGFYAGYDYGYQDGADGEDPDPGRWYSPVERNLKP